MKFFKYSLLLLLLVGNQQLFSQDQEDNYIEFNDRNNIVHGIYLGFNLGVGEIEDEPTYAAGLKLAYVANQQFEVGFAANTIYSRQDLIFTGNNRRQDLFAVYGGLHLEPIFFSKSIVSLSFPVLIGGGAVGYIENDYDEDYDPEISEEDIDAVFVIEPGVSALFNLSRYVQLEAGVTYRFSSIIELEPSPIDRINGFTANIGIKMGIFNMGRNRYKKKI
ncbi:hypothetical protein [Euzebyella saccharophila]|uniref:Outer membrane protein beta-barrel domain-containing protein n=1 Tax=Euzebyella saccharophila TaxID=679664 RepID=A0ABV8JV19_9FLAO|nr:hypothetical protein [Euzebyella saccharophila]